VGILTNPGIAENTWVMAREVSRAGFSASAKSERYNRGIISEGLTEGAWWWWWWCEFGGGWGVGDIGVLGGTESDAPPQGEMGDAENIGEVVE
jgi:hypothetical protein